jgi:hypothetical protein
MLQGSSRGERLARGLKTPRFCTDIIQGAGKSCLLSFRSESESPRVVMERVLPSVVRTEASKSALGCRPSGDEVFAN